MPAAKPKNEDRRAREFLTTSEIGRLITAAGKNGRYALRNSAIILIMHRHSLRVSELAALRWDLVDVKKGVLHFKRLKNGIDSVHPLRGPKLRALRKLKNEYPDLNYLFVSERGGPLHL